MYYGYGYGFNHKGDGVIPFDTDAQAFITAASITDPTQQSAVNQLVVDLKAASIWTKMKAVYPMVGGSASSHKWNLKDPRDLDAAFRMTFSGGWTHNSNGITGNETNTIADTKLNASSNLSITSGHISIYSRTQNVVDAYDIGAGDNSDYIVIRWDDGKIYYKAGDGASASYTHPNSEGLFCMSWDGATTSLYKNSSLLTSNASTPSALINKTYKIGAAPETPTNWSNRNYAFASIGDKLNSTEAAALSTAVQTFQTTLSRNV